MLINRTPDIPPSEITPESVFRQRRTVLKGIAAGAATLAGVGRSQAEEAHLAKLPGTPNPAYQLAETLTTYENVTHYNNFYEFGTDKSDPAEHAHTLKTRPWTVAVGGEVKTPRTFGVDDLMKLAPLEDRIYRHRCVEAWSMVIPWVGFPLSEFIKKVEPTGNAKYIEFVTLADSQEMPGVSSVFSGIRFPYREGLRMDEAMNPLALLTFGVYGEILPNQNGAPVRIVLPWKYGFKSAKSIVQINFRDKIPLTTWNLAAPSEYGFYANVNPTVDHPRWSQASERKITTGGLFSPRAKTLMFNGYEAQVGQLYAGMDLRKLY